MTKGPLVLVAGAGVFGSAIAFWLARAGVRVILADPVAPGDNASGVAAGMLAPTFEALTDEASAGHHALLTAARDLWPSFLGGIGEDAIGLRRCGGLWLGLPSDPSGLFEERRAGLQALGAPVELLAAGNLMGRVPGLSLQVGPGLFTPEDWRLSPTAALAVFHRAAQDAGAVLVGASVTSFDGRRASLSSGETAEVDRLVLATGIESEHLAPELAALTPIKGHIVRFKSGFVADGPILRCRRGYAVGGSDGLHVGATMEVGLRDRELEPLIVERLRTLGLTLSSGLAAAPFSAKAAVRAASPDGLPMVGPSIAPRVFLAAGARRNGWLLAPMVARLTAAWVTSGELGPYAARLGARRFAAA